MKEETGSSGRFFDTRYWRDDLQAAFVLFPMSIAFGLGIASISGFPPMAGLVSAVVGMLALFLYGGSNIVICGAAAALAPILYGAVVTLGHGDMTVGYQRTLTVILMTGPLMFLFGRMGWTGKIASLLSHAVVSGLLASIAIILATSRVSTFTGVSIDAKAPIDIIHEAIVLGRVFAEYDPRVLWTSVATLVLLITLTLLKGRYAFFKSYPPQLFAIFFVLALGFMIPFEQSELVSIPDSLTSFHLWPDFNFVAMWEEGVFGIFIVAIITLTLVDSVETIATTMGIDKIDPLRRKSDLNRVVSAMGLANFASGLLGGLSNIPGGAKSTMSAMVGAKTRLVSLFSIIFVIATVIFGRDIMNMIPKSGLAIIIVFTVFKMCAPAIWRHFYRAGPDQFLVFLTTFAVGVYTGHIEEGLVAGVLLQFLIVVGLSLYAVRKSHQWGMFEAVFHVMWRLWTGPEITVWADPDHAGVYHVKIEGIFAFWHSFQRVADQVPEGAEVVHFHIDGDTYLVDGGVLEQLHELSEKFKGAVNMPEDLFRRLSRHHPHSTCFRTQVAGLE